MQIQKGFDLIPKYFDNLNEKKVLHSTYGYPDIPPLNSNLGHLEFGPWLQVFASIASQIIMHFSTVL